MLIVIIDTQSEKQQQSRFGAADSGHSAAAIDTIEFGYYC